MPIRYKLACEQNLFCYLDFCSSLETKYPKSLLFALKITFVFEIHCKKHLPTPKTKPLEGWRLRRLASLGINLPEIANILTGMRHVVIYHLLYSEVLGSCYLLAQGQQMEVKKNLFTRKTKIRSIRIVALADQEGKSCKTR